MLTTLCFRRTFLGHILLRSSAQMNNIRMAKAQARAVISEMKKNKEKKTLVYAYVIDAICISVQICTPINAHKLP